MKISIVTISYNQAKFLERAIRSVLEQDYEDLEYIIVDPGSTDGSLDIINRYQHRLAQMLIEPDCGPPDGLNKGFAAATGEILAYINADDALLPQAVSSAIRWFKHHPSVDVVVGHGYIVDDTGKIIRRFRSAPFADWRFAYGAGFEFILNGTKQHQNNVNNATEYLFLKLSRLYNEFHYDDYHLK